MFDSGKRFSITKFMQFIILSCTMLFSFSVWSETAIATDESAAVIVAGKIIQNQQQNSGAKTASEVNAVQPLQVESDLADGESIRALPTLNEPVIDQANILSASEKQQISARILKINEQAKAQIGVVIVPTTGQEDIFDFAMRIANEWKLGSKKQDNGLLMAIAVNDRRIQIVTGYGLEGVLPDIIVSRIIRNSITPYFKQNQFSQGIDTGLAEIETILNMDPEIAAQAAQELKERQAQALHEQQAKEKTFSTALFILVAGIIGSFVVGKRLSASTAAVAGFVAGLVNGVGVLTSLLIAGGIFFLLITTIAQILFQAILSGSGRGGGSGGGFGGGGGYSGGGGGFGGGGASGSW